MFFYLWWKGGTSSMARPPPPLKGGKPMGGDGPNPEFLPNTTDWLGRWRLAANESNDWQIDRDCPTQQHHLHRQQGGLTRPTPPRIAGLAGAPILPAGWHRCPASARAAISRRRRVRVII